VLVVAHFGNVIACGNDQGPMPPVLGCEDVMCGAGVFRAIRAVLCLRNFSGILAIIATLECTSQALPQLVEPPHRCTDIGN
jgi:hypothetical protein